MIDLYTWTTPNGRKASILLEELGLPYTAHSVDIGKDEQFKPEFLKISPNNRIPAIVDRDTGISLMESGALMIYLADKTGKLLPKDGEPRYRVLEWLMWQMGGPGPMFGQVHHFVKYNKGKAPYAEERYLKEAHRLYGVLDRRLAGREFVADALFDRRHRDLAVGLALRMADRRPQPVSEREALVHDHRQAAGGAERLQGARRTSARFRSRLMDRDERHRRSVTGDPHPMLPFVVADRSASLCPSAAWRWTQPRATRSPPGHHRSSGDHLCRRHRRRRHRSLRAPGRPPPRPPYPRQADRDRAGDAGRRRHPGGEFSGRAGAARRHRDDDLRRRADPRAADRRPQSRLRHEPVHLGRRHHQGHRAVHRRGAPSPFKTIDDVKQAADGRRPAPARARRPTPGRWCSTRCSAPSSSW